MHRHVVPAEKELPGPERAVRLLPTIEHVTEDRHVDRVELGKPPSQERGEVEALGVVVELAPIDRQARWSGEGLGQALLVEQVPDVIADPAFNGVGTAGFSRKHLDLRQSLQDEAGMEVINEMSLPIMRIAP